MLYHFLQFRLIWRDKVLSTLIFGASLLIYIHALGYAANMAGNTEKDLLLDHLPSMNLIPYLSYGTIIFYAFITFLLLRRLEDITYVLGSISLFILVRSFFMCLTHMAPQDLYLSLANPHWMGDFLGGANLFFSGHTGLPFLLALLYWKNIILRNIFLIISAIAAISVLIARLHYSIDVFAAYFIVYGIYHIILRFFATSRKSFVPSL